MFLLQVNRMVLLVPPYLVVIDKLLHFLFIVGSVGNDGCHFVFRLLIRLTVQLAHLLQSRYLLFHQLLDLLIVFIRP